MGEIGPAPRLGSSGRMRRADPLAPQAIFPSGVGGGVALGPLLLIMTTEDLKERRCLGILHRRQLRNFLQLYLFEYQFFTNCVARLGPGRS
jgi:hypothetical protein